MRSQVVLNRTTVEGACDTHVAPVHLLEGADEVPRKGHLRPTVDRAVQVQPQLAVARVKTLVDIALVTRDRPVGVAVATLEVVGSEDAVSDDETVREPTPTTAGSKRDGATLSTTAAI